MAPFMFSGLRQPIVIVVDVTSNTVKLSGLLGTECVCERDKKNEWKLETMFNVLGLLMSVYWLNVLENSMVLVFVYRFVLRKKPLHDRWVLRNCFSSTNFIESSKLWQWSFNNFMWIKHLIRIIQRNKSTFHQIFWKWWWDLVSDIIKILRMNSFCRWLFHDIKKYNSIDRNPLKKHAHTNIIFLWVRITYFFHIANNVNIKFDSFFMLFSLITMIVVFAEQFRVGFSCFRRCGGRRCIHARRQFEYSAQIFQFRGDGWPSICIRIGRRGCRTTCQQLTAQPLHTNG